MPLTDEQVTQVNGHMTHLTSAVHSMIAVQHQVDTILSLHDVQRTDASFILADPLQDLFDLKARMVVVSGLIDDVIANMPSAP